MPQNLNLPDINVSIQGQTFPRADLRTHLIVVCELADDLLPTARCDELLVRFIVVR